MVSVPVFFLGCSHSTPDGVVRRDLEVRALERLERVAYSRDFGDISISGVNTGDDIRPIPGRLLLKISPSEIKQVFKVPENGGLLRYFRDRKLLPADFEISRIEETQPTRTGARTFRLHFPEPRSRAAIAAKLSAVPLSISTRSERSLRAGLTSSVSVQLGEDTVLENVTTPQQGDFFQLKDESLLHAAFRSIGIKSIWRVFPQTEKRIGHDTYRVRKISDIRNAARRKFPKRFARGHPKLQPAQNMENCFVAILDPRTDLDQGVGVLKNYKTIEKVSVDYPFIADAPQDEPEFSSDNQWGLRNAVEGFDINIVPAWDDTAASLPVVVAVIDTGFKEDLDELAGRLWVNAAESAGTVDTDDDQNGYMDDVHGITTYDRWAIDYGSDLGTVISPGGPSQALGEHGTKVAGIIAADAGNGIKMAGTAGATDVQLMNITVGWCASSADYAGSAELAEGLFYAIENGADIANISVGSGGCPFLLMQTVETALADGMVIVASAGNDGKRFARALGEGDPFAHYPASLYGMIAVGGIQRDGTRWASSNYGVDLDIVAPAHNVTTITFSAPDQIAATVVNNVSGTSASAAFVSGACAIILSKFDYVTSPYMRNWLRSTARDIQYPLGPPQAFPGYDDYTAYGLLDAGTAVSVLSNPNDQPLDVDLLVEKLQGYNHSNWCDEAVGGSPDLGIRAKGTSFKSWKLEYGLGDSPLAWTEIIITDPGVTTTEADYTTSGSSHRWYTNVISGYNYLNTDQMLNGEVYTLKLTAENVSGREFYAKDWFIPLRAWLATPFENSAFAARWGWPRVFGCVDRRSNARYQLIFEAETGAQRWVGALQSPGTWTILSSGNPYPGGDSDATFATLMSPSPPSNVNFDISPPAVAAQSCPEGWHTYKLNVTTHIGAPETDEQRVFLDNTCFPYLPGWPTAFPANRASSSSWGIVVADMGGGFGRKMLVQTGQYLCCFSTDGQLLWDMVVDLKNTYLHTTEIPNDPPPFFVADLDGDGTKEICTGGRTYVWDSVTGTNTPFLKVFLLKPDGTPYSSDWPLDIPISGEPSGGWYHTLGKMHFGDIADDITGDTTKDAHKEIVFHKRPKKYYSIGASDIEPGYLHVVNLQAQPVTPWPMEFSADIPQLPVQVADLDADGKDEILVEHGTVLEGDGTYMTGWDDTLTNRCAQARCADIAGDSKLEIIQYQRLSQGGASAYRINLKNCDGTSLAPTLYLPAPPPDPDEQYSLHSRLNITVADLVPGGDKEIVAATDKIRVFDSAGQQVAALPEIDVNGNTGGIMMGNVDADPELEYIVQVERLKKGLPSNIKRGVFIEAYNQDGTKLTGANDEWPVVLEHSGGWWGMSAGYWGCNAAIADVDGNGDLEIIHAVSGFYPLNLGYAVEVLDIQ